MEFKNAIERLSENARNEVMAAKNIDDIIKVFDDNKLSVTKEDIDLAIKQMSQELSDDELASVTGGTFLGDVVSGALKKIVEYVAAK